LNKNLKKIDIAKNFSSKTGFSINFSKQLIDHLIFSIIVNIKNGNFNLKNIGSFKIIHKDKRMGRNPKTGEEHLINSRKSIIFTPSKNLSEKLRDRP
tara:strand:+ start:473 stop:763 length:291 start_codon:yes stop_codon:yes gene_type:complete